MRFRKPEAGSALVLAVFVLFLLTGMGLTLMALSQNELKMSRSTLQNERAFYVAEAGLEAGRASLLDGDDTPDLDAKLSDAAGPNGRFDFDPYTIQAVYDHNGTVIGFEGYGDDVPLFGPTWLDGGLLAAFLTNDPEEATNLQPVIDHNEAVVVFGVGTGASGALEVVQGLVEPSPLLPSLPPCTIMLLGPNPDFRAGASSCFVDEDEFEDELEDEGPDAVADESADGPVDLFATDEHEDEDEDEDEEQDVALKTFWGTDCAGSGGRAGHFVPVVCVQGCGTSTDEDEDEDEGLDGFDDEGESFDGPPVCAETVVEAAIGASCNDFVSGPYIGTDTVADLDNAAGELTLGPGHEIDPGWTDCTSLVRMLDDAREMAEYRCAGTCSIVGSAGWADGSIPTTLESTITFVDGDLTVGPGYDGHGLLFVTGTLSFHASASWSGPLVVVGEGRFVRTGIEGAGELSGAAVVINIAGDDGTYGTDDDCRTGLGTATYHEAELETGDTIYCTDDLFPADPINTFGLTEFRQY